MVVVARHRLCVAPLAIIHTHYIAVKAPITAPVGIAFGALHVAKIKSVFFIARFTFSDYCSSQVTLRVCERRTGNGCARRQQRRCLEHD